MASLLDIGIFLTACFALGALPLIRSLVWWVSRVDLSRTGTGNLSVAAAFRQGGKKAGLTAVFTEITRGIIPVLVARSLFPDDAFLVWLGLTALVLGRYLLTQGGGVTNVLWGALIYRPLFALVVIVTGFSLWAIAWTNVPAQHRRQVTRWIARIACLNSLIWFWLLVQLPGGGLSQGLEFLTLCLLSVVLVVINLLQADDSDDRNASSFASLDDRLSPAIHGEKASRLAQLKAAKFNVLPGWVLPAQIVQASQQADDRTVLLQRLWAQLHPPVIVRSSALGEDSKTSSAAGQYASIGPVQTEAEFLAAVDQCSQSYQTKSAIAYRQQRQIPDLGMAILVQPYLVSQAGGVLFTRNPLDGAATIVLEASVGSAAQVVGGQITPIHLEIPYSTDTSEEIRIQTREIDATSLPPTVVNELVSLAQALEDHAHGLPQDIEWAWDGQQVWILQSRPITTLRPIWTRTIAAEVIPGVIRPLTWSINRPLTCGVWGEIFTIVLADKATGLDFTETATLLGSHAYFNATLLGEIFRLMGLPEQGLEFLLRGKKMGRPPLSQVLPSLPGIWRLIQRERNLDRAFAQDLATLFQPALASLDTIPDLEKSSLEELLARAEQIQQWLKQATYYNIVGPIGFSIRRALFRIPDAWLPTHTNAEITSMQSLRQLATQYPSTTDDPLAIQALEQMFQQWLATYGYLSEAGTDIAVSTWREQQDTFWQLLQTLRRSPQATPSVNSYPSPNPPVPSTPTTFGQRWRLARCYQRAIVKGQISEIYARLMAHLRWTMLAIAAQGVQHKVLQATDDVFFLEWSDLQAWIRDAQTTTLPFLIQQRRQTWTNDCTRKVPKVTYGNQLPMASQAMTPSQLDSGNQNILAGIPASIGCVEGVVRVYATVSDGLLDYTEEDNLVIVVPYTDAGWAPLFLKASAIVAEVGGQLSHGAIVAREYGIPAIMNVPQAMTRLQTGQRVRVDGRRGIVEILKDS